MESLLTRLNEAIEDKINAINILERANEIERFRTGDRILLAKLVDVGYAQKDDGTILKAWEDYLKEKSKEDGVDYIIEFADTGTVESLFKKYGKNETLSMKDVHYRQKEILVVKCRYIDKNYNPVHVVKYKDKLMIVDGHHRMVSLQLINGELEKLKASVIDID